MKRIVLHNGFVLKVGKIYLWGGVNSNLYSTYRWKNCLCRIKKIYNTDKGITCITLYDFYDNAEYTYSADSTLSNAIYFKCWWNFRG